MTELSKPGRRNKIEEYGLIEQAMTLLRVTPKMTYQQVADELNVLGNVPDTDRITDQSVGSLLKAYPELRKSVLLANRAAMRKMIMEAAEFDMLKILKDMAGRLMFMLDTYEEVSYEDGQIPKPSEVKALSSEIREVLKQIEDIHKEVYDMEMVREFLIEVIKVVKDTAPQALPHFIERMKGKKESSRLVSEILEGGIRS